MKTKTLECNVATKNKNIIFLLLLLYSLLPGFAKVFEKDLFFAFNIPIVFFLFLSFFKFFRKKIVWIRYDLFFFLLIFAIFLNIPITLIFRISNMNNILYGLFVFVFPMSGYIISKGIDDGASLLDPLLAVALIHLLMGIIIYGFWDLPPEINNIVKTIKRGTMWYRMSTVSGSLVFSSLMLIGFIIVLVRIKNKFTLSNLVLLLLFLVGILLSQQRSVYIACAFILLLYFWLSKLSLNKILSILFLTITGLYIVIMVLRRYIGLDEANFLIQRFKTIFSFEAVTERNLQWIGGVKNFLKIPSGVGIGQVGQAIRLVNTNLQFYPVADGDYFKILSEVGVMSIVFFFNLFYRMFTALLKLNFSFKEQSAFLLILLGLSIQMIGSNISELYFINFIYWISVGYVLNHSLRGKKEKI